MNQFRSNNKPDNSDHLANNNRLEFFFGHREIHGDTYQTKREEHKQENQNDKIAQV
jgi:hypothetical protein